MGTDMAVIQAYMGHKNITTTDLFQDGGTADVRGRGQDNPETQGGIRHPQKSGIFRGSGYCVEL